MNHADKILYLKSFWDEMLAFGNPEYPQDRSQSRFNSLIESYSGKNRFFHNIDHLVDLFQNYETLIKDHFKTEEQQALAKAFILYHDYVYEAGARAGENEYNSAAIAARGLIQMGFPETFTHRAIYLVRSSEHHNIDEHNDPIGALLMDIDMLTLAGDYDDYKAKGVLVNKECLAAIAHPKKSLSTEFRKAMNNRRDHFLKPLQSTGVFNTSFIKEQFEDKAQANIAQEIEEINLGYYLNPKLYRELEIK